jgi:hypothetical protein
VTVDDCRIVSVTRRGVFVRYFQFGDESGVSTATTGLEPVLSPIRFGKTEEHEADDLGRAIPLTAWSLY